MFWNWCPAKNWSVHWSQYKESLIRHGVNTMAISLRPLLIFFITNEQT